MGVFLCYKSLVIRGQRAWHVKSSLRGMTLEYAWTWRPSLQSRPNRHARRKVRLVLMIYEINIITGLNGTTEEKMTNGTLDHKDTKNDKYEDKRLPDLKTQVRHV